MTEWTIEIVILNEYFLLIGFCLYVSNIVVRVLLEL